MRPDTLPDQALSLAGVVLSGRYRVERLLGEGTFSHVLRAEDLKRPGNRVAIKILKQSVFRDETEVKHFRQEVSVTQTLDHPNIVRVLSSGSWEGRPYLVMEYVEGATLREYLTRQSGGKLSFKQALVILDAIARALEHAHRRGAVHRDIKPENIMVGSGGRVKLVDFGFAHQSALSDTSDNQGLSSGTPQYMPPEQFRGEGNAPEADIYALGILAYEMLTGTAPFDGDSLERLFAQHSRLSLPRDIVEQAGVPCWFEKILLKATDKNPENRYRSVRALRSDILRNARSELGAGPLDSFINFIRPNGVLCTALRRHGWTRPRIGKTLLGATAVIVALASIYP